MAERDAVRPVRRGPPIGPSETRGAPCASIEDQINKLELDIAGLQADLMDAPPKYFTKPRKTAPPGMAAAKARTLQLAERQAAGQRRRAGQGGPLARAAGARLLVRLPW